jgi:hypothetical protein
MRWGKERWIGRDRGDEGPQKGDEIKKRGRDGEELGEKSKGETMRQREGRTRSHPILPREQNENERKNSLRVWPMTCLNVGVHLSVRSDSTPTPVSSLPFPPQCLRLQTT